MIEHNHNHTDMNRWILDIDNTTTCHDRTREMDK